MATDWGPGRRKGLLILRIYLSSLFDRLLPSRKRKAIVLDDKSSVQASDQAETGGADIFWPKDLLPKDLPNCRICTWGYNVDLNLIRRDTSTATVFQHAKNLLSDLADARMSKAEKTRPLIFVAHSLGGIFVKDVSYPDRRIYQVERNVA